MRRPQWRCRCGPVQDPPSSSCAREWNGCLATCGAAVVLVDPYEYFAVCVCVRVGERERETRDSVCAEDKQRKGNGPHNQASRDPTPRHTRGQWLPDFAGGTREANEITWPHVIRELRSGSRACSSARWALSVAHDLSVPSPSAPSSSHVIGTAVIAAQVIHRRDAQPPRKGVRGQ